MATFVETDCTITREGHTFESGGAVVTPDFVQAYPATNGVLNDWHGNAIGTWRETSSWLIYSDLSDRMYQIEAVVDGVIYTGRGLGLNMIYRGKRKASQSR